MHFILHLYLICIYVCYVLKVIYVSFIFHL